jgi:lipopolysaccharide/colanic/teichoic acid biosynthesis glycosyltransferase
VGAQEQVFAKLKFRTMIVGADALRDRVAARNEAAGVLFKIRRDPRVTRVGRFLRRTSLDEVPSLATCSAGR